MTFNEPSIATMKWATVYHPNDYTQMTDNINNNTYSVHAGLCKSM